jgi:hypothetical protein
MPALIKQTRFVNFSLCTMHLAYFADREITNTYENLQIVQYQFFTDMLIFSLVQNILVYWYLNWTSLINGEKVFRP